MRALEIEVIKLAAQLIAVTNGLTPKQAKALIQLKHSGSICWKPYKFKAGWGAQTAVPWIVPKRIVYDNLVRNGLVDVAYEPDSKSYALSEEGKNIVDGLFASIAIRKELELHEKDTN